MQGWLFWEPLRANIQISEKTWFRLCSKVSGFKVHDLGVDVPSAILWRRLVYQRKLLG